jgi:thymidylate synthase
VKEINSRGNLALETGKLIFHSKNCHIYERQNKLIEELLKPKSSASGVPRMATTMKGSLKEGSGSE